MSTPKMKLGDFATVISGYAFKSEWFGSGNDKVIRIGDLQDGSIQIGSALTIDNAAHGISSNFKIKNKDILMALSGATVGKIAVASSEDAGAFINQRVAIIRANEEITADYLKFFFDGKFLSDLLKSAGGAAQPNLSPKQLLLMEIPLPPLDEQRRIAAILEKAEELRQKRQQAIEKLDQLLQATFIDMFGDPVTNPKGWEKLSFGHLIKLKSGNGLISQQMNKEGSYPVYGGNGICGTHDTYMFDEPKITIGRVGQYCGSVHTTRPQAWITDNALYVSEYLKEVNIIFLEFILKMAELNQYAGRAAQPLVSGSRIYPVETIYPPMQMQEDFADRIIKIINISRKCTDALVGSDKLFKSFQSRAFIGNL